MKPSLPILLGLLTLLATVPASAGHSSWAVSGSYGAYGSGLGVSYYHGGGHHGHNSWGVGLGIGGPVYGGYGYGGYGYYGGYAAAPAFSGYYARRHWGVAVAAPVVVAPPVVAAPAVYAPVAAAPVDDRPSVAISGGYVGHHGGVGISAVIPIGPHHYGDERDSYNSYLESIGSDRRSDISWNDRGFRRWLDGKDGDTYRSSAASSPDTLQQGTNATVDGRLKSHSDLGQSAEDVAPARVAVPNQGELPTIEDAATAKRYVPSRRQELEDKLFKPTWPRKAGS